MIREQFDCYRKDINNFKHNNSNKPETLSLSRVKGLEEYSITREESKSPSRHVVHTFVLLGDWGWSSILLRVPFLLIVTVQICSLPETPSYLAFETSCIPVQLKKDTYETPHTHIHTNIHSCTWVRAHAHTHTNTHMHTNKYPNLPRSFTDS